MEIFNELPPNREQAVDDFLTFIPIYESKMRHRSLRAFLKRNQKRIQGRTCLEAGAGRGLFANEMLKLGAKKVIAVERSAVLHELLSKANANKNLSIVHADITTFKPKETIDVLFHEFYGPLVLDEALPALQKLQFKPGAILPDGGTLWAMPLSDAAIARKDEVYEPNWKKALSGALISDLFSGIPFQPQWKIFDWSVRSKSQTFRFTIPKRCDWIAMCGEITHESKSVLKMWATGNWPIIYTPVAGKEMELKFRYADGYTKVYLRWV
jgi:Ribosomal RNA adenine dimethylase